MRFSKFDIVFWSRVSIFHLVVVGIFGLIMRYKMAFPFPFFTQKYLQHAHSHFAFAGWLSLLISALIVNSFVGKISHARISYYTMLMWIFAFSAWGMLICFSFQGYGVYAIIFSSVSLLASLLYCALVWKDLDRHLDGSLAIWFKSSVLFSVLSTIGTLALVFILARGHMAQTPYLTSVYWYLHFQYNGWLLFSCMGLFVHWIQKEQSNFAIRKFEFLFLALSCIPAYGLSVLWLKIPLWIYALVATAALVQISGWAGIFYRAIRYRAQLPQNMRRGLGFWLLILASAALSVKFILQLGSVIPVVNQWAFGYRTIVIAYLHLIFLLCISIFLLAYLWVSPFFAKSKRAFLGVSVFAIAVVLNELVLGIQGICIVFKYAVPWANQALFFISIFIVLGSILLFFGEARPNRIRDKVEVYP